MILEASLEAAQMQSLGTTIPTNLQSAILQGTSETQSMSLRRHCDTAFSQGTRKAINTLSLRLTLTLSIFGVFLVWMVPIIIRFNTNCWGRHGLQQMGDIRMLGGLAPTIVQWPSCCFKQSSAACQLSQFHKKFTICIQQLLMCDCCIVSWCGSMTNFHKTFNPGLVQPIVHQIRLVESQATPAWLVHTSTRGPSPTQPQFFQECF